MRFEDCVLDSHVCVCMSPNRLHALLSARSLTCPSQALLEGWLSAGAPRPKGLSGQTYEADMANREDSMSKGARVEMGAR